jgi:TolA-binding protein
MKACCSLIVILVLLLGSATQPAAAQLGFDLAIKKPAPFDNRELKSEKSGTKKFNVPRHILQNTFTHYNYFFNANNRLNEIVARAKETFKDDYSKLLPFYNYELSVTAQDKGELDSVIYKAKTGIVLHDLRNDWVDDLYLLWGQAYYLQEQYDSAYQMFQFINYAFADKEKDGYYKYIGSRESAGANRITSDEKVKFPKSMIADIPSRNTALLWQVRSMIGDSAMVEAGNLLTALRNDPQFPERLRSNLEEVQAWWFYKQEHWDSTALHLVNALDNAHNRQERARWEFLAAQLFEKSMHDSTAITYYNKAIDHTTDPVLELYARLNLIRINKAGGEHYIDQNIEALLKMAKRDKYTDYRDAIYYMAGEMELARSNYAKAQEYFLKASKYKGENPVNASKGFLQLADLFYNQKNYILAKQYYDSVQTEALTQEKADELAGRKEMLTALVDQLLVVQRQDSLLRLAAMPQKERDAYIKKLGRELRRQHGIAEESTASTNPAAANIPSKEKENADLFSGGSNKGEWYFYNENTRTQGAASFKRVWGKRPNVDNWRRNADVVAQVQSASPDNASGNPEETLVDEAEAYSNEGLLKNIPLTDEAKQQSNDQISNALYTAGRMYTDKFEDFESAIKVYEDLRKRFPEFASMEEVLFQLFYSYTKLGNTAKAEEIKRMLDEKFPDGRFTGIAKTGNDNLADTSEKAATKAYEGVYDMFLEGKFSEAKAAKQAADSIYGTSSWSPQLMYIEAVYDIKQGQDSAAKDVLRALIEQSGDTPIGLKATTLLNVLNRRKEIEQELQNLQIERPQEEVKRAVTEPVVQKPVEKQPEEQKPVVPKPIEPEPVLEAPAIAGKTNKMATNNTVVKNEPLAKQSVTLKSDTTSYKTATPQTNRAKVFTYQPTEPHLVVVLLNKVDVVFGNEAKNAFARYNKEKYGNRTLDLNVIPLDENVKLLSIGSFANIQDAVDYVQVAKPAAASEIVPWLKADKYSFSLISESNLQLLLQNKDLANYQKFLDKNLPVKF